VSCPLPSGCRVDAVWHPMLGGLCSSLALLFETPGRATELMLFLVPRGLDVCYRWLVERRVLSPIPRFEAVVCGAAVFILLTQERTTLKPTIARALDLVFGPQ
jgi:hypothetical protein